MSKTLTLPPLNWYYFISSLLKSKFGKTSETSLIHLTLLHVQISNSAYSLMKNFLIDTNYFQMLKFETQLLICKSLHVIWSRLNKNLLTKFINKIKIFLKQCDLTNQALLIPAILDSMNEFCEKSENENYSNVLDFYYFILSEFCFNVNDSSQIHILNKLAFTFIAFDDDDNNLINYINALEDRTSVV